MWNFSTVFIMGPLFMYCNISMQSVMVGGGGFLQSGV
jgi:hypothetical protein